MIVADTNIIAYFYLHGDFTASVKQLYQKDSEWAVPILWRSEFLNVLATYIRKKIISLEHAQLTMDTADKMLIHHQYATLPKEVLDLVASSSCSSYDCEFVYLAKKLKVPLVTADRQILNTFPEISLSPQQYLNIVVAT